MFFCLAPSGREQEAPVRPSKPLRPSRRRLPRRATIACFYDEGTAEFLSGSLGLPTAREVAEGLLRGAANFHANPANPAGCLMVHGALVGSDESEPLRRETRDRRARLREAIRERLERALIVAVDIF
jgi:hypothetical protein